MIEGVYPGLKSASFHMVGGKKTKGGTAGGHSSLLSLHLGPKEAEPGDSAEQNERQGGGRTNLERAL